jgi:hypothetical protein
MAADLNEIPQVVAANLGIAVEKVVAQCPAAEEALAYLAQCAPAPVPMTLFAGVLDNEEQRLQAISALAEISLVQNDKFDDGTPAVTVPPPHSCRGARAVAGPGNGGRCQSGPYREA